MSWNVNGIVHMSAHFKQILEVHEPDILFLSETKRHRAVNLYNDMGDEQAAYRAVQVRSSDTGRGGMVAMIKLGLQVETVEIIRMQVGDEFAQAIVLADKQNRTYIGWYKSPLMSQEGFGETLHRLCTDYDTQVIIGDFNARHPRWCTAHDRYKRGARLLKLTHDVPQLVVHAPTRPTFMAIRNRAAGTYWSSTVDLLVSRTPVGQVDIIDGYLHECSDHHPIAVNLGFAVDKVTPKRRVTKTLLQSSQLRSSIGTLYEQSLDSPIGTLQALQQPDVPMDQGQLETEAHNAYEEAKKTISQPWLSRVKQRSRGNLPHVTKELRRIWAHKKVLYDRMRWRPTNENKRKYKEAVAHAQWRERQLKREHERRTIQRIQRDPTSNMAKALQLSAQQRARQIALDSTVGKLLRPRQFAQYLNASMQGTDIVTTQPFEVNRKQHEQNVILAINSMDNNKAVGTDAIHVEMAKANVGKIARLLTEMWQLVGASLTVPREWLEGITVPLYKGKGSQSDPKNYRPLTILSHIRKLTEKAVIIEFDKQVVTDDAQYGFLAGVQVIQASLGVLTTLQHAASYLAVLDLSKAYDSVGKQLLIDKVRRRVDPNLANQVQIFFLPVTSKVAGDIENTLITMNRGLTQGGTSSPALFRAFIDDLPAEVRTALREKEELQPDIEPMRLVADDVVGMTHDVPSLQTVLDACFEWATQNGMRWNPMKLQVLCTTMSADMMTEEVHLGGAELRWVDEVDYLGLRLNRDGFLGKQPADIERKCKSALHMLLNEDWFTLEIEPRHIVNEFSSRVRSKLLYGAELLSYEARKPFIDIDRRVVNLFLVKLLNLGRDRPLHQKHQTRIQLALKLPTLEMTIDKLVWSRIATWIERRTDVNPQVAKRANKSILDILKLQRHHPLRVALGTFRPTPGAVQDRERRAWCDLRAKSAGVRPNPVDRQLLATHTVQGEGERPGKPSFIETPSLNGELRKAAIRWIIYCFPVPFAPNQDEKEKLAWLPRWQSLTPQERAEATDNVLAVYNAEEAAWGEKAARNAHHT